MKKIITIVSLLMAITGTTSADMCAYHVENFNKELKKQILYLEHGMPSSASRAKDSATRSAIRGMVECEDNKKATEILDSYLSPAKKIKK